MMVLHPGATSTSTTTMQKQASLRRRRSKGTIAGFALKDDDNAPETTSPTHSSHPQHATLGEPEKPCHGAHFVTLCAQNMIQMGARTRLNLCPPGPARRQLQEALQRRAKRTPTPASSAGYYALEDMVGSLDKYEQEEQEYLMTTNTFIVDSDEEASSGDEDALIDIKELLNADKLPKNNEKYENAREPLLFLAGGEANITSGASASSTSIGKLPFNRRKIKLFDNITAEDWKTARNYIRTEMRKAKQHYGKMLLKYLTTRQQKDQTSTIVEEGSVAKINAHMTPSLAAALLVESILANPKESIEGMAKCYDAIVAAGVALLDSISTNPTLPTDRKNNKHRPSRSEIMASLAPMLITSLEQPSGDAILLLATLRQMCGTPRYQRRFVQRIAPALIRPPHGAIWCLRQQNDMEAILAAAELLFDSAFDVFRKGWYERGQLLLQDSKRAETLDAAAKQLRSLSSDQSDGLALGGTRRRLKTKKDVPGTSSEPLAEWEVIAVDRQIRTSISNLLSTDWSKSALQSDMARAAPRTKTGFTTRLHSIPQGPSMESPKSMQSSPHSPSRSVGIVKAPKSPPSIPSTSSVSSNPSEVLENVFGPSFALQPVERAKSPPPPGLNSPTHGVRVDRSNSESETHLAVVSTPPRSPISPKRITAETAPNAEPVGLMLSPKSRLAKEYPEPRTPLSPASVGTAGSGEVVSYKPSSVAGSASSPASTSTSNYRMLTSTAAERKRTVAACRALRAQIQRFEESFLKMHGRPPKGALDRAPLATTYAQYREWKRAIRADAACRIQALFRGAYTRWMLLRSNDQTATRVVMRRAGRVDRSNPDIMLPADIGQPDLTISRSTSSVPGQQTASLAIPSQPLAPQWASRQVRPRTSSAEYSPGTEQPPGHSRQTIAATSLSTLPVSPIAPIPSEFDNLPLSELQARKRDLKQRLKEYDMSFAKKHGRMPVKAEKEPIRHLYESYNTLKKQINAMEKQGGDRKLPPQSPPTATIPPRAVSPTSGSESGTSGNEDSVSSPLLRDRHRVPRSSSPQVAATPSSSAAGQDLTALKAEKSQLHQMLRSYEREFYRENKRQVSSFADIRPVASQYRRYKEIKRAIAQMQGER